MHIHFFFYYFNYSILYYNLTTNIDELDSYMYQTVGYDGIKYISECMGVPLFQNDIVGDCIVSGLDYVPTKNDEVEDLYNLLLKIKVYIYYY